MRTALLVALLILVHLAQAQWTEHVLEFAETVEPRCVKVGDMDGDGDGDIVACSYSDNRVVWYEQLGPGSFSGIRNILDRFGMGASALDLADLDSDGDLDVLGTWEETNEVGWIQNNGGGAFSALLVIDVNGGYQFRGIGATDVDGDGDQDVVSAIRQGSPSLAWYANDGSGVFSAALTISSAVPNSNALRVLDIDLDGDPDLLLRSMASVVLLKNDGAGNFTAPDTIGSTGFNLTDPLEGGDLDGDGDVDVVHGYGNTGLNLRWTANVNGSFPPQQITYDSTIIGMTCLRAGDLDNDGDADLIMGGNTQLAWHVNDGLGNFGAPILLSDSCPSTAWLEVGDLDLDGDLDVVCASRTGSFVAWVDNLGGGSFSPMVLLDTCESYPLLARMADLDSDGDIDIVRSSSLNNELSLIKNIGNGTFAPAVRISNTALINRDLQLADLDGDGDIDILSTRDQGLSAAVEWFANDGTSSFGPPGLIADTLPGPRAAMPVDVDMDGDRDIIVIYNGTALQLVNDGAGGFQPQNSMTFNGSQPFAMTLGDAEPDGDTDLVLSFAYGGGSSLSLFQNDGSGAFGPEQVLDTVLTFAKRLALLDLDGDSDLDLLLHRGWGIYTFTNTVGAFGPPDEIALGFDTIGPSAISDLNGDGLPDLLINVVGPAPYVTIRAYQNDGTGGFLTPTLISAPMDLSLSMETADIDGDGDIDVLGYSSGVGLSWFENPGVMTGLSTPIDPGSLRAWPNPFTETVFITSSTMFDTHDMIRVIDPLGREVLRTTGNGTERIELRMDRLAAGHYTVFVVRADGARELVRVVAR